MKYLFKNADIVLDQRRMLKNGALLIEDDKILDYYYKEVDIDDAKTFDMRETIIIPLPSKVSEERNLESPYLLDEALLKNLLGDDYIFLGKEEIRKELLELLLRLKDYRRLIYTSEDLDVFEGFDDILSPIALASILGLNYQYMKKKRKPGLLKGQEASFMVLNKRYRPLVRIIKGHLERI